MRTVAALRLCWPLLAAASAASAQQATPVDPVVANFREYRAALERNDLPAAETAAAAALAASEAARGSRTAVLALNLANLRLELGGPYDALTPARTAHGLATASADSGIDAVAAALTLGRAELAATDAGGAPRLLEAFAAANGNGALEIDVYNAAVVLGTWALDAKSYDAARSAWATAATLARTTDDPPFARARALTSEGVAIALAGMDRATLQQAGVTRTFSPADAKAANDAFSIALRLLRGRAFSDTPTAAGLTPTQFLYAQTLAWQAAVFAKLETIGEPLPSPPIAGNDVPPLDDSDRCAMRVTRGDTEIEYPPEALDRYGVGAVVVHLGVDTNGATTSRTIAAAVPPGELADALTAVIGEWNAEKDSSAARNCRMPASLFIPVRFVLE